MKNLLKIFFARTFSSLPSTISRFITSGKDSAIANWYITNGIYKFPLGTTIILSQISYCGYGVRPIGTVIGYTDDYKYIINMTRDVNGDFFEWINGTYKSDGKRVTTKEIHFKRNIEYHFKQARTENTSLAYN